MVEKNYEMSVWPDVSHLIESLQSRIEKAGVEYCAMQKQLQDVSNDNLRLQTTINALKKKPCSKCAKLIECTEMLKKKLKEKDDTISVIGKLFINHNPESYALASQMVNDVITGSTPDGTILDESIISSAAVYEPNEPDSPKTPEKKEEVECRRKESPVVLKKVRNNKRKFLSISSMKKKKLDNGDAVPNVENYVCLEDEQVDETDLLNVDDKSVKSPELCDKPTNCTPPLNSMSSPEILSSTSLNGHLSLDRNSNAICQSPRNSFRKIRRSLYMKFAYADKDKLVSPELVHKDMEIMPPCAETNNAEPMDLEIAKAIEPLPPPPTETNKDDEKQPHKTVWNLKRSRELTCKKLKQTVLSTVVCEKKVDISSSNEYHGGCVSSNAKKSDLETCKISLKENVDETFFEPQITSTHNDYENHATESAVKSAALAESTNKPRTPSKIDDSFDYVPSTSPKYKYKRDAVRKKSERMKLPGQECSKCLSFYSSKRTEFSNSQMRKLLNKCSRHRDKYPVQAYTPPGLWNPVFDDTDDEVEAK